MQDFADLAIHLGESMIRQDQVLKFSFIVTEACNLLCATCNIGKIYLSNPRTVKEGELSVDEYVRIFERLPASVRILEFTGGEPFMKKHIEDIIVAALGIVNPVRIFMPTNGTMPDTVEKAILKVLNSSEWKRSRTIMYTGVSIDGDEAIHDRVRGRSGSYRTAVKTFELLQALHEREPRFKTSQNLCLSNYNLDEGLKYLQQLRETNVPHAVQVAIEAPYFHNEGNLRRDSQRMPRAIRQEIIPLYTSPGSLGRVHFKKAVDFSSDSGHHPLPCAALITFAASDPKGNVIPCLMWPKPIANFRDYDYDLEKILRVKGEAIALIKREIDKEECPVCWTACHSYQSILYNLIRRPWNIMRSML